MKLEMYLVLAAALTVVQVLVAVMGAFTQVGLMKLVGNRDDMPKLTGWAGRAERAHLNMLQNLVLFAALVLVAVMTRKTNETILLGAQLFLWGESPTRSSISRGSRGCGPCRGSCRSSGWC